ncbi:cytochrome P450 [Nonomuraea sp. NPDC046570]|uniref:cytochrome P450 n=1 Tax=Nonomuraea sp. NPDC046570 TaxID=3155255 RepID=UPI0034101954
MLITRHDEARAVLADPSHIPPPVRQDAPYATLGWLRAQVSRFASGEIHAERRRLAVRHLDGLDPARLRAAAAERTRELVGELGEAPVFLVRERVVEAGIQTAVLGAALGVAEAADLVRVVDVVSTGYLSGDGGPAQDAAVAALLTLVGGTDTADAVARAALLLQGHASTAGLVRNALAGADRLGPGEPVEGLLHETLRHDPPLAATRRVAVGGAGEVVELDLVAANRDPAVFPEPERFDTGRGASPYLTFGHGVRPCPGSAHAFAIAAGVVETVLQEER